MSSVICDLPSCPGRYCGLISNGTHCQPGCGACPLGFRREESGVCGPCNEDAPVRDYIYFAFMVLVVLSGHLVVLAVEAFKKKRLKKILTTASLCLLECVLAAVITLLLFEPYGNVIIRSCGARQVSDFYPIFYNPVPNFVDEFNCVSEIVHPLYSFIFVLLGLNLLFLVVFRGTLLLIFRHALISWTSVYYSLIWIPFVVVVHAALAGLIYFSFQYLSLLAGLVVFAVVSVILQQTEEDDIVTFKIGFMLWRSPLYLSFSAVCALFLVVGILGLTDEIQNDTIRLQLLPLAIVPFLSFPIISLFSDPDDYLEAWGAGPEDYSGSLYN